MKRLVISILILLLLVSLSLTPTFAAEKADGGTKTTVKLLDPGAQPRTALRYKFQANRTEKMVMEMSMAMAMEIGDQKLPETQIPTTRMTMTIDSKEVSPEGDLHYEFELEQVEVLPKPGANPVMDNDLKDFKKEMSSIQGVSGSATVTSRGFTKDVEIKPHPGIDPQTRQSIDEMKQSMNQMSAPLPEEPVGRGAHWQVTMPVETPTMTLTQIATYTLSEIQGDKVKLDITIKQSAPPQEIDTPGAAPGVKVSLESFNSSGTGTVELQMTNLVPTSNLNMTTTSVASANNQRIKTTARFETKIHTKGLTSLSAAQPYPIDDEYEDEEEYVPVQPRQRQRTPTESIHQAVVDGDIDQVQQLLSKGADINARNRMGWSLLRTAIQNRRQAVTELLIAKGANVTAKDNSGETPLLVAVNTGQKDTVELLITKGADVNVMGSRGDNALSLAKKRRNTEIVELLLKHGAEEPSLEDMMGDRYDEEGPYPGYEQERMAQRPTRTFSPIAQAPVQRDILADPNEIKARIKTFEGLEKALAEVAGKSQSEMRQWQQKRYDNKTLLIRTVQKQFEDEIGFIRKAAVEEKAEKTTEAIDDLLSRRKERLKKVSRELLEQKRAERQTQAPTRGRTRYSGRSTRGRYPQSQQQPGGDMGEPYAERYDTMSGTNRYQGARRPPEPVDRETENEIRLWTQSTIDKRAELAKGVHEQFRIEISPIRNVADEEEAKKTTAAIDGLLLYRQMRFEELVKKMEEEQRTLQQTQDPRGGRYGEQTGRYPQQTGRYRGRTSTRGGTAGQQQGQQTRRRRR
ncbi:MAG: DUF6263 family protein [Planctomycetota bacterium]|jgi:hypothetical protein